MRLAAALRSSIPPALGALVAALALVTRPSAALADEPAGAGDEAPLAAPAAEGAAPYEPAWCAPELETLPGDICYAPMPAPRASSPADAPTRRRTLVIFLHGLTQANTTWQYSLERGVAMFGKRLGYAMLAPKGKAGIGPGKKADVIAWPTGIEAQREHESAMLDAILDAKKTIEQREGAPFDEVFVMGFSNGAYYASSLAIRGRLDVDGYAVFAGGSAPKGTERIARATKDRKPVFVGVASRDDTAKKGRELAKMLSSVGWPHETSEKPVGHVVADAQLERAVAYLRGRVDAKRQGSVAASAPGSGSEAEADGASSAGASSRADKSPAKKTAQRSKTKAKASAKTKTKASAKAKRGE
jgi:predicted esterase